MDDVLTAVLRSSLSANHQSSVPVAVTVGGEERPEKEDGYLTIISCKNQKKKAFPSAKI